MNNVEKLRKEFNKNKGVRIGETAVVSRKVHTIHPDCPGKVNIVVNSDAGQVFYHRLAQNEITHIDLFHEVITFDMVQMAEYLRQTLTENALDHLMDYIDIQTGSGGGKLTGDLKYGMTESLKKNHLNHVHLAALIPCEELDSLFFLVSAVEKALKKQKVELRKIEIIKHEIGNSQMDMSQYTTDSDSNLKQDGDYQKDDSILGNQSK